MKIEWTNIGTSTYAELCINDEYIGYADNLFGNWTFTIRHGQRPSDQGFKLKQRWNFLADLKQDVESAYTC